MKTLIGRIFWAGKRFRVNLGAYWIVAHHIMGAVMSAGLVIKYQIGGQDSAAQASFFILFWFIFFFVIAQMQVLWDTICSKLPNLIGDSEHLIEKDAENQPFDEWTYPYG
jgi:hypothetical protein